MQQHIWLSVVQTRHITHGRLEDCNRIHDNHIENQSEKIYFSCNLTQLELLKMRRLKRPCIEFGVVRIDSAIVVCIHSAIIQLLLSRRVNKNGWRRHSI